MVDGKICNVLSNTKSSQRCYLCNATPKTMNELCSNKSRDINEEYYSFGLSSLHCWIRCFECLLHISYRLNVKTWCIKSDDQKSDVQVRKVLIQKAFRVNMGLLVDVVKQGKGNTNDGNTARKFFAEPELSASLTGLDSILIANQKICGIIASNCVGKEC